MKRRSKYRATKNVQKARENKETMSCSDLFTFFTVISGCQNIFFTAFSQHDLASKISFFTTRFGRQNIFPRGVFPISLQLISWTLPPPSFFPPSLFLFLPSLPTLFPPPPSPPVFPSLSLPLLLPSLSSLPLPSLPFLGGGRWGR